MLLPCTCGIAFDFILLQMWFDGYSMRPSGVFVCVQNLLLPGHSDDEVLCKENSQTFRKLESFLLRNQIALCICLFEVSWVHYCIKIIDI